jgi:DNA-binding GntR family transcriptional regulator
VDAGRPLLRVIDGGSARTVSLPTRDVMDDIDLVPKARETMTESAAVILRGLILAGRLPPGTPLRLTEVARRLGMSVMPVREALRVLEAERLVTFRSHHGATVAEISAEDVEEAYAVREALEGLAARDGVRNLTEPGLERIREHFRRMEEAARTGDRDALVTSDQAFHRSLFEAGGRPDRARRIVELWESTRRAVPLTYRAWDPLDVAIAAHRPILVAIERRDARAAEQLSRAHTRQAATRVLRAIRKRPRAGQGPGSTVGEIASSTAQLSRRSVSR